MERLTERNDSGAVFLTHGMFSVGDATRRLAEYEDTGLTPAGVFALQTHPDHAYADCVKKMWRENGGMDRMEELAKADAEGRLLVLPCKIGTKVYNIAGGKIREKIYTGWNFVDDAFGSYIFLTKEEALSALEQMKEDT